jgi:Cu2+-exporting ATPase
LEIRPVEEITSIPGKGVEGLEGKKFLVVSPCYLEEKGIVLEEEKIEKIKNREKPLYSCLRERRYLELSHLLILSGRNPERQSQNSKAWE